MERVARRWGHDASGRSLWYFELDAEGWPVRQIEIYEAGPTLLYGQGHDDDRYGGFGQVSLFDSGEDWTHYAFTQDTFERVWNAHAAVSRLLGEDQPARAILIRRTEQHAVDHRDG